MKLSSVLRTELRQYFEIKTDLATAIRDAVPSEIEHHIDELQILAMHTASDKLRWACATTLAEQGALLADAASG
jgi:hypothetical protein